MVEQNTIAVIFDFDDTLAPDSTTKLLREYGVDVDKFWAQAGDLRLGGYDYSHAWLKLFLDMIGDDRPLGNLSNETLRQFGASLDGDFYPGLPELFDELQGVVTKTKVFVEFYIVSSGLREIICGSSVVKKYFSAVYACELAGDPDEDGAPLKHIKRAVTFTEKTRYLYEIHKGIDQADSRTDPLLVNRYVKEEDRPVPFKHMIYVGDGLTDIPCFSLLDHNGGKVFGVVDPSDRDRAKRAYKELTEPKRVFTMGEPKYRDDDITGSFIRTAAASIALDIAAARKAPYARA